MSGPLSGIRIIELSGLGPAPFACMMLADHGAEVIRIDRPGGVQAGPVIDPKRDVLQRSRRSMTIDLKSPEGKAVMRDLAASADGFVEGFRPGVAERLGLGPDDLRPLNARLVYGRMTGWGQTGPYAASAGHDINYVALSGALHHLGRAGEKPTPPVNLVGDFGGGGMLLAFGMVSALLHARTTGEGQVIDCAMAEGAALLTSMIWTFRALGMWNDERGTNAFDTGAHFYDTYLTADGKYISIGAIEPQFYALLRKKLGLDTDPDFDNQNNPALWPALKARLAALFLTLSQADWCALLEHTDTCFAPVLPMADAPHHPHNFARANFVEAGGVMQPAPAPRYSSTPPVAPRMFDGATETAAILLSLGYGQEKIEALAKSGAVT